MENVSLYTFVERVDYLKGLEGMSIERWNKVSPKGRGGEDHVTTTTSQKSVLKKVLWVKTIGRHILGSLGSRLLGVS